MAGASGNIYVGLLEFSDMAFLLHSLRSGDVFADIGANVGVYTILAAKNAGARVLTVEPIPSTFSKLRNNVIVNEVNQLVTLHPIGVGKEESTLFFTNSFDVENHVLPGNDPLFDVNNTIEVKVKRIDEIVAGNEPVVMKMDIEGFEIPALEGAKRLLSGNVLKAIIIELNGSGSKYGFKDDDIHELLLSHGFKPFKYHPFERTFEEVEKYGTFNTIYLKDKEWASERVTNAKKFRVLNHSV